MFSKKPEPVLPMPGAKPMANNGATFSVIGTDVSIKGNIEASADLHVDGKVEGDITCASLVQGDQSRIEGVITAETARLSGTVKGTISVRQLVVLKTARIEGDVHYESLTIEQGAHVDGRFAPDAAKSKTALPPAAEKPKPPVLELGSDSEQRTPLTT